jgi:small-conductance mechanosensitive channel
MLDLGSLPLPFQAPRDETVVGLRGPFSARQLFTITGAEGYSARSRAEKIVNRIRAVAEAQGDDSALVTTTRYGDGVLTLTANDRVLATVTPEDLDVIEPRALPTEQLKAMEMDVAERWRGELQKELSYAAYIRRPEYLKIALPLAGITLLLAAVIHRRLRQMKIKRFGYTVWGLEIILWGGVLVFNLWLFPFTKGIGRAIHDTVITPFFRIWALLLIASLFTNVVENLIFRYFMLLKEEPDVRPRRAQRLDTFASVACKTVRAITVVVVILSAISMLPINFAPILTGAGVVGIAIGLAAQDLLKDLLAGISILIEDRFGVGDWIEWGSYAGSVESVNLLYTQLRTIQGGLVTIPNADLRVVNNLSNEWAQVDFQVSIAYSADLDLALRALEEEANGLAEDRGDDVLGVPDLKGVNVLGPSGVVLRLFLRTKPLLQWDIERELNKRVKVRFQSEGIEIPFPQTAVWLRSQNENADLET